MLTHATETDHARIVDLANAAYRGTGAAQGWNTETGFMDGLRLTLDQLHDDLAVKPKAHLLVWRGEDPDGLLGCVWLEPKNHHAWYLGLLAVQPERQKQQLGRTLLSAAEAFAKARGAVRIRMTVINVRSALIAWYERRGYQLTGETEAFPYGDERFGRPLRDDLHFVVLGKDL